MRQNEIAAILMVILPLLSACSVPIQRADESLGPELHFALDLSNDKISDLGNNLIAITDNGFRVNVALNAPYRYFGVYHDSKPPVGSDVLITNLRWSESDWPFNSAVVEADGISAYDKSLSFHAEFKEEGYNHTPTSISGVENQIYNAFRPGTELYQRVVAGRQEFQMKAREQMEAMDAAVSISDQEIAYKKATEALHGECAELDSALIGKYMKFIGSLKSSPEIPEEAKRHMIRGKTFFNDAPETKDFGPASAEMSKALCIAPWWSRGYYNFALVEEGAEHYDESIAAFKLYLLGSRNAADANEVRNHIVVLGAKQDEQSAKRTASAQSNW